MSGKFIELRLVLGVPCGQIPRSLVIGWEIIDDVVCITHRRLSLVVN
jgi:hypothetical protein